MSETGTDVFTPDELAAVRAELEAEAVRLRADLDDSVRDIEGLINDSGDGSGDDVADAGSKTFEREQDMYVVEQVREALGQVERAIARVDAGTYGICETCGGPIGKLRLEVYPRATQCVACKVAEGG